MRNIIAIFLILFAVDASAHGVKLFVHSEGEVIVGKATYDDDKPVVGAKVAVINDKDVKIAHLTTDSEGTFRYDHNGNMGMKFTVTTPDGHLVSYDGNNPSEKVKITHAENGSHEDVESSGAIDEQYKNDLRLLREDIHRLENTIRFHDIVGGIGYIVGVLGFIALLKRRQG